MSTTSAKVSVRVVDSETALLSMLDGITNLPVKPPSLFIDLVGINLGRNGSVSILSIHSAPEEETYLIDVHCLEQKAFSATNKRGISLKTILQSPTIPKVVFDIRNASDALFKHFQISVDCIKELQLMELAVRNMGLRSDRAGSQIFLFGLAKCVANDSAISAEAKKVWRLTEEDHGGPQLERQLQQGLIKYCEQKVRVLPGLYQVYMKTLGKSGMAFWRVHVRCATMDRIKSSQKFDYDGNSQRMSIGPWTQPSIESDIESWNEDIIMEARIGEMELNEDDEWVQAPSYDFDFDNMDQDHEFEDEYEDEYQDTARDCMGWEEDMVKNGEYF